MVKDDPNAIAVMSGRRKIRAGGTAGAQAPISDAVAGLDFSCGEEPQVSVIVLARGSLAVTARCLRSIAQHRPLVAHEVRVLSSASGDPGMAELAQMPGLHHHQNPPGTGLLESCNATALLARGEYLFFLDDDWEVTAGWLDAALDVFARFPDCGMVGTKLISADGRLHEAGGIVWTDGSMTPVGSGQDPDATHYNHVREVDYCSPAASIICTRAFLDAGGFDGAYVSSQAAGADLAFRLRRQGSGVYYCPRSVVVSHGADSLQTGDNYNVNDRDVLRQRWRAVLDRSHFRPGRGEFRARTHARHKRIALVMDHRIPQPDRDAGSRAMLHTMLQLTRMGMLVKFWPDDHLYLEGYRDLLDDAGIEVLTPQRWGGSFEAFVRDFGDELDFAILSRPNFAGPYIPLLRRHSRARVVFFGHDLHFKRLLAQAELTGDDELRGAAEEMRLTEQGIWQAVDSIIYPSQDEADVASRFIGMSKPHVIPMYSLEAELCARRHPSDTIELLFVAGFAHPPNVDAAEWLARRILPEVKKRLGAITLHLVGSNPTDRVLALASDEVRIAANVSPEVLGRYYASSTVAIVPLRFGAGVKLKVVEAMAYGIPLVTTSVGAQGLPGVQRCISVADDIEAIADAITRLVNGEDHAQEQADRARDYVRENYSESSMQRALWRAMVGGGTIACQAR